MNSFIRYCIDVDFIRISDYFTITGYSMGKIQIMHNKSLIASIITASFCFFTFSALQAGVYKWVDESGQVHYGEQPGNAGAEKVTIRQNETTKPRLIKKDKNKDADKQTKKTARPEPAKMSKKEKRKLCKQAKSDLTEISSRGRLREINKKGEYVYLTDPQKQQRITAAKNKQHKFCR